MKRLTGVIKTAGLGPFGSIVPISDYRAVFPNSHKDDPYFLALKQTIINMAYLCRLASLHGRDDSITLIHEEGDTSTKAFQIYRDLKAVGTWEDSKYLVGFSVGTKRLNGLQGADLIAREAFKHADNRFTRRTRKPIEALRRQTSFHLWTRESLDYLKSKGGPDNLVALTSWGLGEVAPQMIYWFGKSFSNRQYGGMQ